MYLGTHTVPAVLYFWCPKLPLCSLFFNGSHSIFLIKTPGSMIMQLLSCEQLDSRCLIPHCWIHFQSFYTGITLFRLVSELNWPQKMDTFSNECKNCHTDCALKSPCSETFKWRNQKKNRYFIYLFILTCPLLQCVVGGCNASFASQGGLARHVPSHFSQQSSSKMSSQAKLKEESPSKAGLNKRKKLKNKRRCSLRTYLKHTL